MPYADRSSAPPRTEYFLAYLAANRERIYARARKWRKENRERSNALRRLLTLRKMKDPLPIHVRKMAEICARYPKLRIVYEK